MSNSTFVPTMEPRPVRSRPSAANDEAVSSIKALGHRDYLDSADELNRAVVESSRDCVKTLSPAGVLLSIAPAARELLCIPDLDKLIGLDWTGFWQGEDRAAAKQAIAAAAAGGQGRMIGRYDVAGEPRWWDVLITPIRDRAGEITRLLAVSRDVTEQRRTEEELRNSRQQLVSFVENAAIGLHRVASDGTILWANAAELQTLGYRAEEYVGQHIARFHADQKVINDILERLTRGERLRDYPSRMVCKDGSLRDVLIDSCVLWENGKFVHTQCFTRDVTPQLRALETSRRLAAIVESSDDAILSMAPDDTIQSWNRGAEHMFGYTAEEAIGKPVSMLRPEEVLHSEPRIVEMLLSGMRVDHFETRRRTRDGRVLDVSISASPVRNSLGEIVAVAKIVRDVTERKRGELHLRKQRDVLEQIVRSAPLVDTLETLTMWVEEAIPRPAVATILLMTEDRQHLRSGAGARCPAAWRRYVDGMEVGPAAGACGTAAHRKQRVIVGDIAQDPLGAPFREEAMKHGLRACWSTPILSSQGDVLGTFAIYYSEPGLPEPAELEMVDVVTRTASIAIERKAAEDALRDSREKLRQHAGMLEERVAERTARLRETIGELEAFSYSVSHDMRAPLRAMQGYSDRLLKLYAAKFDEEGRTFLTRINKNAQRLELLVRDVLAYSKVSKSEIDLAPVDLDAFVPPFVAQIPELQREDLTLRIQRPLPVVRGHEAYLSQIFSNLLGNAVKFAAPERPPVIEITAATTGGMVQISVRDNGIGIESQHFARIFEIFGRVYPDKKYEGTGIGLAIVKKAVQRMGGTISVESRLGEGSCFTFTLQRA